MQGSEREPNPAVTIIVKPERIGRVREPEGFEVKLPIHRRSTAQVLAERIHKHVRLMLMSNDCEVVVDMVKHTFRIDGGRFGKGSFEIQETGD